MNVLSIHHSSFIVKDTQISVDFYQRIFGITVDTSRPDLGYPGAWLQVGSQQIHLLELPNPDPVENRPAHGGRDRHLAILIDNLDELLQRLSQEKVEYTVSKSGRRALFCRDPDGNALEFIEQSAKGL